jgi:hypothetical protein
MATAHAEPLEGHVTTAVDSRITDERLEALADMAEKAKADAERDPGHWREDAAKECGDVALALRELQSLRLSATARDRLLDEALRQMSDFHASFSPANDADLTPRTSPAAMRRFVDELASLHYQRHRL